MKFYKKTTAIYLCLALAMASMVFSGCGKSKKGGGEPVVAQSWYQDSDGDGFGNPNKTQNADDKPDGYVENSFDCNDENKNVKPDAVEVTDDHIDNNCNGETDESSKAGLIPDTGQIISYTTTPGEDSDYLIDEPSYTKLNETGGVLQNDAISYAMIRDNVTGLIWELKNAEDGKENPINIHDADNTYTLENASSVFIEKLNSSDFGHFTDGYKWRIPTIKELAYLANSTIYNPCVTNYFPQTSSQLIWSSTPVSSSPTTNAWTFWTYWGGMYDREIKTKQRVWAVRGQEIKSEFEKYGSAIIKDKTTGLMWQKATATGDDNKGMTFEEAIEYCENLELGGFKDWRLPSRNELMSLIDLELKEPSINNDFFPDTYSSWYVTSTTLYNVTSPSNTGKNNAWLVDFQVPSVGYGDKTTNYWVKAVRGGNNMSTTPWYWDEDGDGYGDPAVSMTINSQYDQPVGYVSKNTDCNDKNILISPAALDIPDDGIDQNCTGSDMHNWYYDGDKDGYGDKAKLITSVETQPVNYVLGTNLFDCNDSNKSVNPSRPDLVDDGLDNDCDGLQNVSWYVDSDNDGYGSGLSVVSSENPPIDGQHYTANNLDCNELNSAIHPGLVEIFGDDIDSNCNHDADDETQQIVPDTGQITSYTGIPGEDGDYLINPPSFTKIASNGDWLSIDATEWAAIRDNVTGLYWEFKTAANNNTPFTFSNAVSYAESLVLAGYNDWRLPTVTELATIANLDMTDPAIDPVYFPNIVSNRYWTSTDLGGTSKAMTLFFQRGASELNNKTDNHLVITVRQDLATRLIANSDGTVTDTLTGLMWNNILSSNATWNNSVAYWSGIESAGYNDWRLPTESDMDTFMDILQEDSSFLFSNVFQNVSFSGSFWAYTLAITDPEKAIVFSFFIEGTNTTVEKDEMIYSLPDNNPPILRGLGVRGIKQGRLITNNDGTVFDSKTGLMWTRGNNNGGLPMNFESALAECDTMSFADYADWRMPNRNEMISLLSAYLEDGANYSAAFPDSHKKYWTSSSCPGFIDPQFAWEVDFTTGAVAISIGNYLNSNFFRAVRGGNPE